MDRKQLNDEVRGAGSKRSELHAMDRKRCAFPHHIMTGGARKRESKEVKSTVDDEQPVDTEQHLEDTAKELHKPVRHKFPMRMVFVARKDQTWGMDLADMSTWKDENDGYAFLLNVIDVFTRWAASRPLRTKSGKDVLAAIESICKESKRKPIQFWCDEGTEFRNKELTAWRTRNQVGMYHTYGKGKSVIVERFNRTLKTMMWRRLTAMNSHEWVAILPELIAKYNRTKHRTLQMSPNNASRKPTKAGERWEELKDMQEENLPDKKPKFKVGDKVRISRTKGLFEKGYDVNWSREMFTIREVDTKVKPTVYRLADYRKEEIKGSFYEEELQKTKNPGVLLVDKVLKERGKGKNKELFVSWLGYPSSANQWIKASTTTKV